MFFLTFVQRLSGWAQLYVFSYQLSNKGPHQKQHSGGRCCGMLPPKGATPKNRGKNRGKNHNLSAWHQAILEFDVEGAPERAHGFMASPPRHHVTAAVFGHFWGVAWHSKKGKKKTISSSQKLYKIIKPSDLSSFFLKHLSLDQYQNTGPVT